MSILFAASLTLTTVVGIAAFANDHHEAPAHHEEAPTVVTKQGFWSHAFAPVKEFYTEFKHKFHELQKLDETVESQRKQIAELQAQIATLKASHVAEAEHARASEMKQNALAEGGVENARTVESLAVATKKLFSKPPKVIYKTSLKAFENEDYETAAAGFNLLASNEDNVLYHTSEVYFMTGVSFYKLNNFKKAQQSFENVLKLSRVSGRTIASEDENFAPRAMAWLSVCKSRVGDLAGARHMVHELIQSYPKSREARRLNRSENF